MPTFLLHLRPIQTRKHVSGYQNKWQEHHRSARRRASPATDYTSSQQGRSPSASKRSKSWTAFLGLEASGESSHFAMSCLKVRIRLFDRVARDRSRYACFVRIVAAAVWIAALTNFGCHPASRPLRGSLEFRDSNWAKGELSGHVVYRAVATDRVGSLRLYWGRDKLKRLSDVPIANWSHAAVPLYYYFLDRPRPSGATHLLLFAIDKDGDDLTPPLALEITDTVHSTLAFRPLGVRCGPPTDDGELLLLRSVDDVVLDQACSEQLLNLVDFSRQIVIHFAVDIACPGDFGSRVQGLKYSPAIDLLEIYVNIWSSHEYEANCHQDFWLAIDRLPTTTKVRLVRSSACEHPAMCSM